MVDAGTRAGSPRVNFLALWALLLLAKLALAATLPLFGDEAFYALESRRLAWAYSDLPGLTAWLVRLGTELGGQHALAVRAPFLLMGAALPWLVVRIAARWFGPAAGWQAGLLALLLPLGGAMGVLALPDVPMLLAALLCLDAFAAMLRRYSHGAALQLAFALALGAFAHYRFALVVLAGAAGLLCSPAGRALLRRPGLWLALAAGAAAWWPTLAWNLGHAGAGLGFQFVDRHPWQPQLRGLWWPLVQALLVTPLLMLLLLQALGEAWRRRRDRHLAAWGLMAGLGFVAVPGYFLMGFFADAERVTFHWPLAGWLALCALAPPALARWRPWARRVLHATAAMGLALLFGYLALLAKPEGRSLLADGPAYADNFSGWHEVADAVRGDLAGMPVGTTLVADNFMLGAQLAFELDRGDVRVLDHPLNAKHGRAVQLADWGLLLESPRDAGAGPLLLVVEDTARPLKHRLQAYRDLCAGSGGLPPPRVLSVDHGRKRFLRFVLPAPGACVLPALAWIDAPLPGAAVRGAVEVSGWAFKQGGALARIELTLDGEVVAVAEQGLAMPHVADYWGLPAEAGDGFGFRARVDLSSRASGRHWLGLVLHGADGSVERWPEQVLVVE